MAYYLIIENDKIISSNIDSPIYDEPFISIEVTKEIFDTYNADTLTYIYANGEIIPNPNYEADKQAQERAEKDQMTLTPSDVERALLAAKGWDFEDLKTFLKNEHGYTDLQIKAIGVELRANDFFRGAVLKGTNIRIVDTIGALLGYTTEDMDYLFEHKELPVKEIEL